MALAGEAERSLFGVLNLWVLGLLELSLGDAAAAERLLHDLPDQLEQMGYVNPGVRPVYADAIEARIAAGDLDVEPLIDASRAAAPSSTTRGRRRRPDAAAGCCSPPAATSTARSPCSRPRSSSTSAAAAARARAHAARAGTVQRRAKRRGEARETLGRALELFDARRRRTLGREGGGRARAHPRPRARLAKAS